MNARILICTLVAAAQLAPASAQTVDELVAKYIQARGGMEALAAVKSIRYTGKMSLGPGIDAPLILEQKRPANLRLEFTMHESTAVQAFNGREGWLLMPFGNNAEPQPMTAEDLAEAREQAEFDGPLIRYTEKGHRVELLGKEPLGEAGAFKLKVTLKGGGVRYIFLDAGTSLDVREETTRSIGGSERVFETTFGDYRKVQGLVIAHAVENGLQGAPQTQKILIEKVEINPSLDDSRFAKPEVKKPQDH